MSTISTPKAREVMDEVHFHPAISIIMPFEPKMNSKKKLANSLKLATDKIEQELLDNYSDELGMLMIQKLEAIISNLNYSTHKKSIAIYVNPVFEKVLYLDIAVEERIIVGESFQIGDLIYSKKQINKYLVLLLGSKESRMYLVDSNTFVNIISDPSEAAYTYINDLPEAWTHFYDIYERKEILVNRFFHHIDNTLGIILNGYRLPLFVLGTEKLTEYFKKLSKHTGAVIEYIYGNYEEASIDQLKEAFEPYAADWKTVLEKDLLNRVKEAAGQNKLAIGIREVWREAMKGNGRLLIVEKNFMYTATDESIDDMIYKAVKPYGRFSHIKDAVDDVIEKVLESGGDVEFVNKDIVKDYSHIAMVKYY